MFPTLVAVRNERVVATLSSPRVGTTLTGATTMAVGLAPQALVLAAEGRVDGRPAVTYAVMTRDLQASSALQDVLEQEGQVTFGVPQPAGELYLARSAEAGQLALEAGLPRACLLQPEG